MDTPKQCLIDLQLVLELVTYLEKQPFKEVAPMLMGGTNATNGQKVVGLMNLLPAPEAPKAEEAPSA